MGCWLLGWLLLSPFRLSADERFAGAAFVGFMAFTSATALWYSQTFTSLSLPLLGGLLLYIRFARPHLQFQWPQMLPRLLGLLGFASVAFAIANGFAFDQHTGLPWVGNAWMLDDLTYWGHLSEALKLEGRETPYFEHVFAHVHHSPIKRYHYVGLWASSGVSALFASNTSLSLQLVVWPSLALMSALALWLLLKRLSGSAWLAWGFAFLAMTGQFWAGWILSDISVDELLIESSALPMWLPVLNKLTPLLCVLTWLTYAVVFKRFWLAAVLCVLGVVVHPFMTYYLCALWVGSAVVARLLRLSFWRPALGLMLLVVLTELLLVLLYAWFDTYELPGYSRIRGTRTELMWQFARYQTWLEFVRALTLQGPALALLGVWLGGLVFGKHFRQRLVMWVLVLAIGMLASIVFSQWAQYWFSEGHQMIHVLNWLVFSIIMGLGLAGVWQSLSVLQRGISVLLLLVLIASFHWRYTYGEWQRYQNTETAYSVAYVNKLDALVRAQTGEDGHRAKVLSAKYVMPEQYENARVHLIGRFLQGRAMGRLVGAGPVIDLSLSAQYDCEHPASQRVSKACRKKCVCQMATPPPPYIPQPEHPGAPALATSVHAIAQYPVAVSRRRRPPTGGLSPLCPSALY